MGLFSVRVSRIRYFEGLMIGLIDGLPDLYFPHTVEGTGSGTGNSIYSTDVIRVVVGSPCRTISLRPDPPKHAIVLTAVKDKPSAAPKKRRP
jgi:hypothetical protein